MLEERFKPMKPQKIEQLPNDIDGKVFQLKVDGGNAIIDVELPNVEIYHAREETWTKRTYRYPLLVAEIRQGNVLRDNATYVGELTCLDKDGVGRHWLFLKRQLENNFTIQRMSKLLSITFYPHHIIQDKDEMLFSLTYEKQLELLSKFVKDGKHIKLIPTARTPDVFLEQKGLIEGIVIKNLDSIYYKGKRGSGWFKLKFLKEKTVKFISYEKQEVGIRLLTDDEKPFHLAGNDVKIAIDNIDNKGCVMAELEFYAMTDKGFRDAHLKRIYPVGDENKQEI